MDFSSNSQNPKYQSESPVLLGDSAPLENDKLDQRQKAQIFDDSPASLPKDGPDSNQSDLELNGETLRYKLDQFQSRDNLVINKASSKKRLPSPKSYSFLPESLGNMSDSADFLNSPTNSKKQKLSIQNESSGKDPKLQSSLKPKLSPLPALKQNKVISMDNIDSTHSAEHNASFSNWNDLFSKNGFSELKFDKKMESIGNSQMTTSKFRNKDLFLQTLHSMINSSDNLQFSDIENIKNLLNVKLRKKEQSNRDFQENIFKYFLYTLRRNTLQKLDDIAQQLRIIKNDIEDGYFSKPLQNISDTLQFDEDISFLRKSRTIDDFYEIETEVSSVNKERILAHLDDLENIYYSTKKRGNSFFGTSTNSKLIDTLNSITKYRGFQPDIVLKYGDGSSATAIVSSIEFDKDDAIFAVSGVTRKIKIFDYNSVVSQSELWESAALSKANRSRCVDKVPSSSNRLWETAEPNEVWPFQESENVFEEGSDSASRDPRAPSEKAETPDFKTKFKHVMPISPLSEIINRYKISCLSYNSQKKSYLACSDYEGIVTVWDTNTNTSVIKFNEHEKRAWSVDFSKSDWNLLSSGSDDGKVKIWNLNSRNSVITIQGKANICCVRFNPEISHYVSFGCADHNIYYYDLRNSGTPLSILKDHRKAVSYVRFASSDSLISASTDSSLKLWDLKNNSCVKTFTGHTNEKNFVGLSISDSGWISCGSENNSVYTYNINLSRPVFQYNFGYSGSKLTLEKDPSLFVGAVCWKKNTNVLLAANSQGSIRVLKLE
ncbi:hypothetical protein BB560_000899 [Smittium megazygosporum]|uniref:Uncharacterized protein n=1 Tax=Smittium megazygosporum TaxID=133381 RepID=A0A2T9ZJ44_9FUNG|nr:hypothetical protein BB560_000899 [Smittium megazygosporum]